MLVRSILLFVSHLNGDSSSGAGLDGVRGNGKRTTHQAGNRCAGNHCFLCHVTFLFRLASAQLPSGPYRWEPGKKLRRSKFRNIRCNVPRIRGIAFINNGGIPVKPKI
jgi:hypothetical protein